MIVENIGKRIKELRILKKLTQKQLSEQSGVAFRTIQNYEAGMRVPTLEIAVILADFFDISLDDFVGRVR